MSRQGLLRLLPRTTGKGYGKNQSTAEVCNAGICPGLLRHTFGRRLRAADVSEEDRKDLLGHKSRSVTTEYSGAEIHRLIDAANKVCDGVSRPMLRVIG